MSSISAWSATRPWRVSDRSGAGRELSMAYQIRYHREVKGELDKFKATYKPTSLPRRLDRWLHELAAEAESREWTLSLDLAALLERLDDVALREVGGLIVRRFCLAFPGDRDTASPISGRRRSVIALALSATFAVLPSRASQDAELTTARRRLRIGDSTVDVVISERPGSKHVFCNLHDDENTAVEAGLVDLRRFGGRLVELRHGWNRDVAFRLGGETFAVDPNRIFTTEGARRTLGKLSRRTPTAEHAVERFAEELLSIYAIERADVVIALHNNLEGRYSALSYDKGGDLAADAAAVFIKEGNDPDDFFFVTERVVFEALRRRGYNVVLQDNRRVTDDGSLSVYCGRAGVRYINVEAQHGHREQQVAMLTTLRDVLEELGPIRSR